MLVKNKYSGDVMAEFEETKSADTDSIIAKSKNAFNYVKNLSHFERYEILLKTSKLLEQNSENFARTIAGEAGKPLKYARNEVKRAAITMLFSAEESKRIHGETVPMDIEPRGVNRFAFYTREPIGPVLAITPFNDPLNLVAHKIGPAIAAGNSVINKPSTLTPISAVNLKDILIKSGLQEDAIQILFTSGEGEIMRSIINSDEIKRVTFTGGVDAGRRILGMGRIKKYSMELGNDSPVIIWNDADLDSAAELVTEAAFESQGENCIHAQRILIKDDVYDYVKNRIVELSSKLRIGDPLDENTDIGPMISESEALRVEDSVKRAVADGADLLLGGERNQAFMHPTVLELSDTSLPIWGNEIFGPVTMLKKIKSFEEAISLANGTAYGLQAGVFTSDLDLAMLSIEKLDFGTVLINDTSDFRIDTMPFGGLKNSGIGREGVRFSIEDMTEMKLAIIKR